MSFITTSQDKNWAFDKPSTLQNPDTIDLYNRFIGSIKKSISEKLEIDDSVGLDEKTKVDNEKKISFDIPNYLNQYYFKQSSTFFSKVQKWIGNVIEINGETFKAKLLDLTAGGTFEIGEFDVGEVSADDKDLFRVGAGFYWSIGHAIKNGQSKKESILKFQRLSSWSTQEYDSAADYADFLAKNLNWD